MSCRYGSRWASLLAALVVVNLGTVQAVQLNSASFNHKYEGDIYNNPGIPNYLEEVDPLNNNQTPFSLATGIAGTTDGNVLQFKSDSGDPYADLVSNASTGEWLNGPNAVVNATGWTIEFSIKIGTDAPEGTFGAFQLFAKETGSGSTTKRVNLTFGGSKSVRIDGNIPVELNTADNTDAFHVFRIAEVANSSNITVWRDGVQIYAGASSTNNSTTAGQLYFGDGASVGGPTVLIDYLRWDSTGPYEPVVPTILHGDYNHDDKVDAADYVLWRKDPTNFDPDAYDVWRANFGKPAVGSGSALGSSAANVPEPAVLFLTIVAGMGLSITRRKNQRQVSGR